MDDRLRDGAIIRLQCYREGIRESLVFIKSEVRVGSIDTIVDNNTLLSRNEDIKRQLGVAYRYR